MSAQLAGPGDSGDASGQEDSDIVAKSLDGAEIDGKAMGNDPTRQHPLVREPAKRALRAVRAHA